MQAEINAAHPAKVVRLLGVNAEGAESANAAMCEGRVLPWLQDTAQAAVWAGWAVTYRDVVILGTDNVRLSVHNLTEHDLSDTTNYNTLKATLLDAAR
ncbi:MAG: hypothetical protein HZB25_09750 [Candidatus Eisenbacteria bacterium]|nr:hypothetical protein [Candidatus Eisenbacteria bacterium]